MAKPNWKDKTIWTADNLLVMRGMNSESVDLIYLDPPFNSKRNYAAPIGSKAAGAEFKDTWTLDDVDVEWVNLIGQKHPKLKRVLLAAMTNSDKSYLVYMAVRILEMQRILKPTGSIYLHCDPTMSHYLKLVMDAVFGKAAFRNEIVWLKYAGRKNNAKTKFSTQHDSIFFYAKSAMAKFNGVMLPHTEKEIAAKYKHIDKEGRRYRLSWGRHYQLTGKNRKIYLDESPGRAVGNLWIDDGLQINTSSSERTGYPTQKPVALLERIIKASSDPSGDGGRGGGGAVIFHPFCGCATTLVAADRLQRQWVGVDVSKKAAELVVRRIKKEQGLFQSIIHRTDIPQRTDLGRLRRYNHPENKTKLYGEQGGDCAGCREHFPKPRLEVDHIIARSNGGTDDIKNLQLLCTLCNKIKGNRDMDYLITQLQL